MPFSSRKGKLLISNVNSVDFIAFCRDGTLLDHIRVYQIHPPWQSKYC